MSQVSTFNNDQFKLEFIVIKNGDVDELWFKGKEIATVLEYSCSRNAIAYSVNCKDRKKLVELGEEYASCMDLHSRNSIYINESGLYCFIFGSKKPIAEMFKMWITREVLPSIRRTGSYTYSPATAVMMLRQKR